MLILEKTWQEDWLLYHKVIFDGINKLIIIVSNTINAKEDIYSAWKEWVLLRDNSKFAPALRVTGGDPISGGGKTGDIYFTINNWRIAVQDSCEIVGVIYSDDYSSPYIAQEGAKLVNNVVSNLVQSLGFNGSISINQEITPQAIWDHLMADATTPGSIGERISKLLTVAKYLGLK